MTKDKPAAPVCCSNQIVVGSDTSLPEICQIQHAILENAGHAIIATDRDGTILYFNRAAQRLLGYSWHEVVGRASPALFHAPEEVIARARVLSAELHREIKPGFETFVARLDSEGLDENDWTYVRKDGSRFPVRLAITAVNDTQGELLGYLGIASDISLRRQMEQELRITATAFESQAAIMVTDVEQRILRVNPAFTKLTGYSAQEAVGQKPSLLKSGRQDATFYRRMWGALQRSGHWQGEIWNRRKSGEIYPEWLTISAIHDEQDRLTHYVSTFSDISNLKVAESEIHNLAFYDPLTALPNRRLLLNRLDKARQAGKRNAQYGALLMIDLDNFKTLNDTLGHDIGDHMLVEVANRLRRCMREGDTAARQGGDDFVVMLEELGNEAAAAAVQTETMAEKIRHELALPYRLKGATEHFRSASIGISIFCGQDKTTEELVRQADIALYKAKEAGRNAIRFFDNEMQIALDRRATLEAGLRNALLRNEFLLYVQPQVDSACRLVGAEALIRWQPPRQALVAPDAFIPLAEETGLIVPIGLWVLDTACARLRHWADDPRTRDLYLSVNVSACQFRQADFVEQVSAALIRHGVAQGRLKIELTESLLLENVADVVAKMQALRTLGVCFSLDDFGTGYASLSYLKRFPFEQLKVDRSFIRDILTDADDAAIVSAIVAMGNALRLSVVAEGVEEEGQHAFLVEHGCQLFQGYLFGRPVPFPDFEQSLG
ncbi:MAG: EAL domain-containing protein [Azonexus sp.]|nr:EAL domain-containing protein [Azonexus sp.]